MKLSRNKIAKLLKTGNQSRRRFRSKSLTNKDLILDVNTSRNNTSLTLPPAKTKPKTAAKTEKKHRQSMKKKRRGLNLRYKTLKRWGGAEPPTSMPSLTKSLPIGTRQINKDLNLLRRPGSNELSKEEKDFATRVIEQSDEKTTSIEVKTQSTTSNKIKQIIKSILNGSHCEFIDVAFVPHLTTYLNSDAKYKKPYNSIYPKDEEFMGFPYPQQPTTKATSTDIPKFEEGLFSSAQPSGGGAMSGGLPLMKNPLEKLNDIKTNLDKLNKKISQYTTFFDSSLNAYSQNDDISLNNVFGDNSNTDNLHNRQLLQKILKNGKIVYEKNVILKTNSNDNTKIKRDVFDKGDYKFFNELIEMKSANWKISVDKKSNLFTIKQNLFDLLTTIATRMNDVDAGPDAGLAVTQKIVESIPQITLENIIKKSFLGIIALFLSIYTGFNKCQEDFDEWKKNYSEYKDKIEIQKIYKEIEKTLAEYKKQFDEGTIGGISDIRTTTANEQMELEINDAKNLTTKAIMSNTIDDPTTKLELIEKLKIKYYLQYLAYSFIMPNGNLEKEITKNQCINVLNKIKNIVAKNPITLPAGVAPVETAVTGETVSAAVEAPTSPAPVINDDSIDKMLQLFTTEPSDSIDIAKKKKLTQLLTPNGALYEAIYTLEANLNRLRAKTMTNGSVTETTTDIYDLLENVISQKKELNNMDERQSGGGDDIEVGYDKLTGLISDTIGKLQTSTDKTTIENIDAKAALPQQLSGPQSLSRSIQESSEQSSAQSSAPKSIRNASVRNEQISRNMDISPKLASTLSSAASTSAATSENAPGEIVGLTLKNEPSSDVILKLRAIPPQAWASTTYNTTEGNIRNLGADMMGSNDRDKTNVLLDILRTEKALDEIGVKHAGTSDNKSTGPVTPTNPTLIGITGPDAAATAEIKNQLEVLKPMIEKFKEYLEALNIEKNKQGGGGQVGGKRNAFNQVPDKEEIQSLLDYIATKPDLVVNDTKLTFDVISPKLVLASKDFFTDKDNLIKWKDKDPTMSGNPITTLKLYIKIFELIFKSELFKNRYDTFQISSMTELINNLSTFFNETEKGSNKGFRPLWTRMLDQAMAKDDPNAGKIKELNEQIAQLQKELAAAQATIKDLQVQLASLNTQQTEKEAELTELRAGATAAEAATALAQTEIDRLTAEKNKTETEHAAALQALQDKKTKVESDLAILQNSTSQTDQEKTAELKRLTDEKAVLDAKIREENTRFETEKAELQNQLQTLQAELQENKASAKKLQEKNAAAIEAKEVELAEIKSKAVNLQSEIDAAKLQNTTATTEMEELKKQLEASQAELGTTKTNLEKTQGELDKSNEACERNDAKLKELEQLLEKNQKDLKEAEKKNFDSKMSIVNLLESHTKRYEDFLTKINSAATPASVEVLPESASKSSDESANLKDKSAEIKLGDGNAPSSTGKKEL